MKKQEMSTKKETILYIISVVFFIVFFLIIFLLKPSVIIYRGGVVSDYSKYEKYSDLVNFFDNYGSKVLPVLGIIALVICIFLVAFAILRVTKKTGSTIAKVLFVMRWITISLFIIFTTMFFNYIVLYFSGVRIAHCWCAPDYVRIEYQ